MVMFKLCVGTCVTKWSIGQAFTTQLICETKQHELKPLRTECHTNFKKGFHLFGDTHLDEVCGVYLFTRTTLFGIHLRKKDKKIPMYALNMCNASR